MITRHVRCYINLSLHLKCTNRLGNETPILVVVMAKVQRSRSVLPAFARHQVGQRITVLLVADVSEGTGPERDSVGTVDDANRAGTERDWAVVLG